MFKFLIYLLLFENIVFGCAACQLMTPTAHLAIDIDVNNEIAKNIHVTWNFSKTFSEEAIAEYDKNHNKHLEEKELDAVRSAMLDYLLKKDMLTQLDYGDKTQELIRITPQYKNFEMAMVNDLLIFSYDAAVRFGIHDGTLIKFVFKDDEDYFNFNVTDLRIAGTKLTHDQNLYLFTAFVTFNEASNNTGIVQKPIPAEELNRTAQIQPLHPQQTATLQTSLLKESIEKMKNLFRSIKDEKNPLTYLFLLLFAYIYGVIHALGPGHGKTLVASYFLSNERSYLKALYISAAIGVVHTFSAFLLTVVIYFMVDTFLAKFLNDTVWITTKISAFIIIGIALYSLRKKYKAYTLIKLSKQSTKYSFSAMPHIATCGCSACKVDERSTDAALIISAGIIPCPGTTAIFIFAISLGLYYAGFLSALVMSLGMSTIIFFSALFSTAVRKKTLKSNGNLKQYLEYGSLAVILILGLALLFA
ncbi:DUF1007 family protein [Sulfuricurvum sp.]|uniref:nickel/cobalt transporter n=1 Tax=Sulfuricurvum sp. TaxID=2025608 RepID=UPI00261CE778|nr:DUF1007 family protein [Sulfuricurvum sp.]MDD3596538.1 DUF1007 family protein [Sulfuricurvum sp.]